MATAEETARRPRLVAGLALGADRIAVAALACVALAAAAWILHEGRGLIFFYDEWDWLIGRRDGLDGLFDPHNGHFSLVPVAVFKLLFATAGAEHYGAYRLVAVVCHVLCGVLLFVLVRRRLGPVMALAAATLLLALGAAWQVILWPFEISYTLTIAAGLGALLASERASRRAGLLTAALVLVALASSGLGLAVAAGLLAELLADPARRRRVWVVLWPLLAYAAWYLVVLPTGQAKLGNVDATPGYMADAAAGAVGAVAGLGVEWGRPLLVLAAIVVVMRLLAPGALPARLVGLLVMGAVYWGLLGLSRADLNEPVASRYVYFGAVIVLLIAAEIVRRDALPARGWILLGLALCCSLLSNLGDLREGSNTLRGGSNSLRAALTATELAGAAVPATTKPEPNVAPQLAAGPYRELVADLGSPIGGPARLLEEGPASLGAIAVDAALARVEGVAVVPGEHAAAADPPVIAGVIGGRTSVAGGCVRYVPEAPGAALDLRLDAGTSIIVRDVRAPAELRMRRLASGFAGPLGTVGGGVVATVVAPRDPIAQPWVLRLSTAGPLRACTGAVA